MSSFARLRAAAAAPLYIACAGLVGAASPSSEPQTRRCASPVTAIGMSTPKDSWTTQLAQVPDVQARRLFASLGDTNWIMNEAKSEIAAGRLPVLSFKIPGNDWAGAAKGNYDPQLRAIVAQLAAMPGRSVIAVHHEPYRDGPPEVYAAMQRHILPILSIPKNVDSAVILNGSWWTARSTGLSDAQIATWLPPDVISASEIVAADTYQGGKADAPGEDAGVKIKRFAAWATRVGAKRLGIAEYNGLSPEAVTSAGDAILADQRFEFGLTFNSNINNRKGVAWRLEGDRLAAFKRTVAKATAGCRTELPTASS